MRTKVITRMATGVCSVCLCYGLVIQAMNGDMAAEALSPDARAREQLQAAVQTLMLYLLFLLSALVGLFS